MFPENNSGIVWFLGCIIFLTLSGVFLSILVDKRLDHSSQSVSMQRKVDHDQTVLEDLELHLEDDSARLEKSSTMAEDQRVRLDSKKAISKELADGISSLRHRKEELIASIPEIRENFDQYRTAYRKSTWRNAVGDKVDRLVLITGREYEKIVINRVTDVGLEISHAHGNARIDFKDLGRDWQDKFQWDDEGRTAVLEKERRNSRNVARAPVGSGLKSLPEPAAIEQEPTTMAEDEVGKLRIKVRTLRAMNATMESNYNDALTQSRYSNQRSVPGQLRTWKEQAAILENELAKARAQLALAVEELRLVSPSDPLLVPDNLNR